MSELFNFEQFPQLQTERLILREIVAADAEAVFQFRSDPEEQKHNDAPLQSLEESHQLIERLARQYVSKSAIQWGLTLRGDNTVIGLFGYNYWDRANFKAAIGYDLKRAYWGRGIMPEALRGIIDFGFERMNLNRIEAHTNTENAASVRMLAKLGFWQEGTFHDQFYENGEFHDVSLFVLLRRDYLRLKQ
jgi:ribosomal-protein-alanine N-acetyltransferase